MFLLAALLLAQPQASSQNSTIIEGRVVRAGTMEPIPNAQVTLGKTSAGGTGLNADAMAAMESLQQIILNNPGLPQETLDRLASSRETALGLPPGTLGVGTSPNTTLTDAAGHFSFKDQAAGRYTLRVSREGFFGPPVNGQASSTVSKSFTVEANKATSVDLTMIQGGVISGRVRDPNGQPARGVTVAANRVVYSNGRPQWQAQVSKTTDDRGEYRIFFLGPGEYYVGTAQRTINPTVPNPQDSWARTFFPGVSDPTTAAAVVITNGSEIPGVDFTIQSLASTATFTIKGKAVNPFNIPNPTTGVVDRSVSLLFLAPREPGILDSIDPPTVQNVAPTNVRTNGEFEIRNVRPGSYDLIAGSMPSVPAAVPGTPTPPRMQRYYIDRKPIEIRNSDITDIDLELQKGFDLRGQVVAQGTVPIPLDRIRINLHSRDTIPETFATIVGSIVVDAKGMFASTEVPGAKMTIQVTGLPATAYVADIQQSGISVFDTGITVGQGPVTQVEILVNANGETIEGTVQNAERKPAPNATVVLVPPVNRRQNAMLYKNVTTDSTGHFSIQGVVPGEYTIYAWENVAPTAWMNAEFLAKYPGRGKVVVASQGTHLDAQLDLIPDATGAR